MITRRERRILAATAVLAVGVPAGAAAWVRGATGALAARLTEAGGVEARIGGIDADLTGAIRVTGVALGELASADALEASVAMASLLGGRLRADEVRVDGPRIALRIDPDGDSDLARLARRLARHGHAAPDRTGRDGAGARPPSLRRVLVARGALTARIAGVGELAAEGVELIPDAGGVRVITGPIRLRGASGRLAVDVTFARAAADLALPEARFGRVLAVGGAGTATAGTGAAELRDVAAGRLAARGPLELRATVADGAAARPLAIDVGADLAIAIRGDRVPLRALAGLAPAGLDLGRARASGTLTARRRPGAIELSADGAIDDLVVDHPAFAPHPAPLSGRVRGDVTISRDAIAWTRGGLELGAARLSTSGWLRRGSIAPPTPSPAGAPDARAILSPAPSPAGAPDARAILSPASSAAGTPDARMIAGQLDIRLAPAPCADLLASLPPELRGPLDGMALNGTLGARVRLMLDLAAPAGDGASIEGALEGGCSVAAEPPAADVTALAAAGEQQLLDGSRRRIGPGEPDHVALRALPAHVPAAFVVAEDARFFDHRGFDLEQIARSLEIDLRERRLVRGGSTISQQLVKNAFLSQRRSFDRKLHEAVLAWRLEARLDKRQILERYLNVIELGPRVFGLGPAARHWFGVPATELTVRQAAFLAALTSQPASMSRRVRRAAALDPESAERVAVILRAMRAGRTIGPDAYEEALAAPLRFERSALRE